MSLEIYDLNKRILVDDTSGSNNSEVIAPVTLVDGTETEVQRKKLDLKFMKFALERVGEKRAYEAQAIAEMRDFSEKAKEMLFSVNESMQEAVAALRANDEEIVVPVSRMTIMAASTRSLFPSITSLVNTVKSAVDKAIGSVKSFISSINPANGLKAISNLAKFLLCPEETFLGDIKNAINTVVNSIANFKPYDLLSDALGALSQHLLDKYPIANNIATFFSILGDLLMTNIDKKFVLDSIIDLLGEHGYDLDYFNDYNLGDWLQDYLNPNSPVNGGNGSSSGNPSINIPNTTPKQLISNRCSELGKLISQLENAYRNGNRFDDLITDPSMTKYLNDPDLKRMIEHLFRNNKASIDYYNTSSAIAGLGYSGKTAMNSAIAISIENTYMLQASYDELDEVGEDSVKLEAARINLENTVTQLSSMNNVVTQRLLAFDEGINNIERENDFYDLSKISGVALA